MLEWNLHSLMNYTGLINTKRVVVTYELCIWVRLNANVNGKI